MTLVGCDLHTRKQQFAVLNTETGEIGEQELLHAGDGVEQFYAALPKPSTVGIETTGYALWFHELLQRLGHTLLITMPLGTTHFSECAHRAGPQSEV